MSEIKAIHTDYGVHSKLDTSQSYLVRLILHQASKQANNIPSKSLECQFLYCFLNPVFCKQEKDLEKLFLEEK